MWLFTYNHTCFGYIQITTLNNKNTFGAPYRMNVKLVYNLKDLGITSTLRPTLVQYNGKHGKRSEISRRWRVKRAAINCKTCKKQRKVLPS